MRITPPSLLLALVLGLSNPLAAQDFPSRVMARGGVSLPVGENFDLWEPGLGIAGAVGSLDLGFLELRGDLTFSRFDIDERELLSRAGVPPGAEVEVDGGELSLLGLSGTLVWPVASEESNTTPYFTLGAGYVRQAIADVSVRGPTDSESIEGDGDNAMSLAGGAGLRVDVAEEVGLLLESRYVWTWDFGDPPDLGEAYVPIEVGVALGL